MLNSFGKLKTYLGEIVSLTSMVIGFGMILANQAPGPWPRTTSVLVVLLSIGFLWGYWWPNIQRKSTLLLINPQKEHWLDGFLDLVRQPAKHAYQLSLWKRRLQSIVLFGLTATAGILIYPIFSGVLYEINPPDIPEWTRECDGDKSLDSLRIVVAEFNEIGDSFLFEDRIVDQLLDQSTWGSGVLVCKVDDTVTNRIEARQLGESKQAAIVVWGRADPALYEVHLEIAQWKLSDHRIPTYPTPQASAPTFQMREPVLVSFVVEYTLSQLLYVRGDTLNARIQLENAIDVMQQGGLTDSPEYKKNFMDAYFMLGYFYDEESPNGEKASEAIKYYSQAIDIDNDFYPAYINRAFLYNRTNQLDLALADYNIVIEHAQQIDPEVAAKAYINLAWIYVDSDRDRSESLFAEAGKLNEVDALVEHGIASLNYWKEPERAVIDFSTALTLNPDDPYIYNHLGKAELIQGQFDEARSIYQQALESAVWEEGVANDIISNLESLAADDPNLKPVVKQITHMLKAAKLP